MANRERGDHPSSDTGGNRRPRGEHSDDSFRPGELPQEDKPDLGPLNPGELRAREERGRNRGEHSEGGGSSRRSQERGEHGGSGSTARNSEDAEQSFFNDKDSGGLFSGMRDSNGKHRFGFFQRKKIIFLAISTFISLVVWLGMLFFSGIFNLPNFMKNIEQAGFQRYQIDLQGRSDKWLQAYMELRFGEVDDPNLKPKDRDNIFFKADKVDTNKPLTDWYRTLRGSKFEEDVFNSKGIRFTSIAYKDGNIIKYRPGIISFKNTGEQISFDPGQATFDKIAAGDPNAFNGALADFVQVDTKFESDKEARSAIKAIAKEQYPGIWKSVKRYHVRQDIQNMIGVRKWTFFEKTRAAAHEKKISMRNRLITAALPQDSKSGEFIKCLFGVPDCSASEDVANPDAQEHVPTGTQKEGDKTDGDPKDPKALGDGTGESTLTGGVDGAAAGDMAGKILSKLIAKAGILSLLDSLSRFDEAIHDHTISKLVSQAKSQWAVGAFSVVAVAADQLTTGQQSSSEVNDFMNQFQHATNNEGWVNVVDPQGNGGSVAADSAKYVNARDKKQFCSNQHQAEMAAHPKDAENEFQYLCTKDQVGGPNQAQQLEDDWNSGPGSVLHPVLAAYHSATGGIFDVFNSVTSAVTTPIVNAALSVTGTQDDVEHLTAWAGGKALEYGGAVSPINEKTPSGQVSMQVLQGSAVQGESTTRYQGGIPATVTTMKQTQQQLAEYQADQAHTSLFNRYLSPSNPKSLFATELFALGTSSFSDIGKNIAGIFGSALSNPFKALTQPAHAAVPDGYAACKFTYYNDMSKCNDIAPQCLNQAALQETPQSATNADELGYFKPGELNWDLMTNEKDWYKALYDKVGGDEDKALQVYNCALFDDAARGGIGARYGYKGVNTIQTEADGGDAGADGGDGGGTVTVSGDAQQIAQDMLANSNITYQYSAETDVKLTAQGKAGTNGVPINIQALQIPAALAKNHKVVISAYESYGQGHSVGSDHYSGHAVDIASIDGVVAYQNIFQFYNEFSQYSKGAVFLQKQCGGTAPPAGADLSWLSEDACTHQHISVGTGG